MCKKLKKTVQVLLNTIADLQQQINTTESTPEPQGYANPQGPDVCEIPKHPITKIF